MGLFAGALSVGGYVFLSPALERCWHLTDTCGVANLHGMPGVLGGLASALFSWACAGGNAALLEHGKRQPLVQLAGLGATLAAAVIGGVAAGWLVSRVDPAGQALSEGQLYEDSPFWTEGAVEEEDKAH